MGRGMPCTCVGHPTPSCASVRNTVALVIPQVDSDSGSGTGSYEAEHVLGSSWAGVVLTDLTH